jgi:hypothetical protein
LGLARRRLVCLVRRVDLRLRGVQGLAGLVEGRLCGLHRVAADELVQRGRLLVERGLPLRQRLAGDRVVHPGQDLSGLDAVADLDQHLGDGAAVGEPEALLPRRRDGPRRGDRQRDLPPVDPHRRRLIVGFRQPAHRHDGDGDHEGHGDGGEQEHPASAMR